MGGRMKKDKHRYYKTRNYSKYQCVPKILKKCLNDKVEFKAAKGQKKIPFPFRSLLLRVQILS